MTKIPPYLSELGEILEIDPDKLIPEFVLSQCNWDSLAMVSCVAILSSHDLTVDVPSLSRCETIGDIQRLVAPKSQ